MNGVYLDNSIPVGPNKSMDLKPESWKCSIQLCISIMRYRRIAAYHSWVLFHPARSTGQYRKLQLSIGGAHLSQPRAAVKLNHERIGVASSRILTCPKKFQPRGFCAALSYHASQPARQLSRDSTIASDLDHLELPPR